MRGSVRPNNAPAIEVINEDSDDDMSADSDDFNIEQVL